MSQRLALVIVVVAGLLIALSAPASAAATNQISGTAQLIPSEPNGPCRVEPNYPNYSAIVMVGSLEGCWYTKILTAKQTPSGVYLESGEELFVGTLNGHGGTFTTTYKFEAKLNPDGSEIRGRCQHKIVAGTEGFEGASGRVDFKDIIDGTTVTYEYRGHIRIA
jgi:hypothetical protein